MSDHLEHLLVQLQIARDDRKLLMKRVGQSDVRIGELLLQIEQAIRPVRAESVARTPSGADADPQAHAPPVSPAGGFFTLHALTPRGRAKLPEIEALLAPLLETDPRNVCLHGNAHCEECAHVFGKDYM